MMFEDSPETGCSIEAIADMAAMARQAGLRSIFELATLFLILSDE